MRSLQTLRLTLRAPILPDAEWVMVPVEWGFDKGGLDRIESAAFKDNLASRRSCYP